MTAFSSDPQSREVIRLQFVKEKLEVDISELEQQKRMLTATIKRMSYKKRSWWRRLIGC